MHMTYILELKLAPVHADCRCDATKKPGYIHVLMNHTHRTWLVFTSKGYQVKRTDRRSYMRDCVWKFLVITIWSLIANPTKYYIPPSYLEWNMSRFCGCLDSENRTWLMITDRSRLECRRRGVISSDFLHLTYRERIRQLVSLTSCPNSIEMPYEKRNNAAIKIAEESRKYLGAIISLSKWSSFGCKNTESCY